MIEVQMSAEDQRLVEERQLDMDRKIIGRWMLGNAAATAFVLQFFYICHLWDDLIDRDKERTPAQINLAFWMALVELPANRFYQDHWAQLHPVMVAAINDWHTANVLAMEDGHGLDIAFSLRCSILTVVTHCALLLGGPEWAREVGPQIRLYGQRETLREYKADHKGVQDA